jgi:hypothetical protein
VDAAPELVPREFLETSLMVFEGDMTCCAMNHRINGVDQACDRQALLLPLLGLCVRALACDPERSDRAQAGGHACAVCAPTASGAG